ncbi:MAG: TRAP transporter small permease [Betaproteobacteria bacterium]|nr:TRAP transporter small permease [Betaproteobacteria bacterium]
MNAIDRLEQVLSFISGASLSVLAAGVFLQVVMRYVFSYTPFWSEEAFRILLVWCVMAGAAVSVRDNQHIRVDFIVETLPPGARRRWALRQPRCFCWCACGRSARPGGWHESGIWSFSGGVCVHPAAVHAGGLGHGLCHGGLPGGVWSVGDVSGAHRKTVSGHGRLRAGGHPDVSVGGGDFF